MAKTNPLFVLIGVLVVAFVILLFSSSSSFVPYDNEKHSYATYEPMSNITLPVPGSAAHSGNVSTRNVSAGNLIAGSMNANSLSRSLSVAGELPLSSGKDNFEPMLDVPQTVQYGPFRDSEIIDRFSQVTANGKDGVDGCVSSGLSNAGGYICLTPDLIDMLKTRGGNAKGV